MPPNDRANHVRNLALGALALVVVGSVGIFVVQIFRASTPTPEQTAIVSPPPTAPANPAGAPGQTPPAVRGPVPPSFDIVRIGPEGEAVVAGHGDPGAALSLRSDGNEVAHATVDRQGAWALTLDNPLAPGPHTLTLLEHTTGGQDLASAGSVLMTVPGHGVAAAAQPPLAVLTTPHEAPRVLQAPPPEAGPVKPGQVGLGAVDYDAHGDPRLAGTAAPNATVRLYSDNHLLGEVQADKDGRWSLVPGTPVAEGAHQLRLDQLGPDGKVVARAELPFKRDVVPPGALAAGRIVVQPGNSLWRIAHQTYGNGVQYTIIYQANHDQIRNPDLIYPGQVFMVPPGVTPAGGAGAKVNPASSSTSR